MPALPPGMELWTPETAPQRPVPGPGIFHGPIGQFSLECAGFSEAEPVAIHCQGLVQYGTSVGGTPHVDAGNARHPAALHVLIVGKSAKGGKGTAFTASQGMVSRAAPEIRSRTLRGFGSGEALIAELASGTDERLLVMEEEFGALLAKCRRDGSTLATTIRAAWDGAPLANRTRSGGKLVAEKHHVGAIGHITAVELRDRMSSVEIYGGTANRWLHIWAQKGSRRPDRGNVPQRLLDEYGNQLRVNLHQVRSTEQVSWTPEAEEMWDALDSRLYDDDPPGLLGHVVARSRPQVLRLTLVYALADGVTTIEACHVGAASALWSYSRATAAHIYGEGTGNTRADRLLTLLREAGPAGLDATAGTRLLGGQAGVFPRARNRLEGLGLAVTVEKPTRDPGRPRLVTYALRDDSENS
jgi:hypothetical protein